MKELLKLFTKHDNYADYKEHCKQKRAKRVGERYPTNVIHNHLIIQREILTKQLR
jgi:hypothetical protein